MQHNGAPIFEGVFLTPIGGYAVRMINKTGAPSVLGTVVENSPTTDFGCGIMPAGDPDLIGVMYGDSSGNPIADGSEVWVVTMGVADVLLENDSAATRHFWCKISETDNGRVDATTDPTGPGFITATEHFREIGHAQQSVGAGTDVMCRINLHFN